MASKITQLVQFVLSSLPNPLSGRVFHSNSITGNITKTALYNDVITNTKQAIRWPVKLSWLENVYTLFWLAILTSKLGQTDLVFGV